MMMLSLEGRHSPFDEKIYHGRWIFWNLFLFLTDFGTEDCRAGEGAG
jgi:hypothetical protein